MNPKPHSVKHVDVSKVVGSFWVSILVSSVAGLIIFSDCYLPLRYKSKSNLEEFHVIGRQKWVRLKKMLRRFFSLSLA